MNGSDKKLFVIGFNKTATTTIAKFFNANGVKALHWKVGDKIVAEDIETNIHSFKNPLSGYSEYSVFTDLESTVLNEYPLIEAYKYYEVFHRWYPKGRFILNTRNINSWIESRLKHGGYLERYKHHYATDKKEDVVYKWKLDYYKHHYMVLDFFKDKRSLLLDFDIDRDGGHEIKKFLCDWWDLDPSLYGHDNKTMTKE